MQMGNFTHSHTDSVPATLRVTAAVVLSMIAFVGCVGNALILCALRLNKALSKLTGRLLLQHLALSDLLFCVCCTTSLVIQVVIEGYPQKYDQLYLFWFGRWSSSACAALQTTMTCFICGVSVMRYVQLMGPQYILEHRNAVQRIFATATWCIGVTIFAVNMTSINPQCNNAPFCAWKVDTPFNTCVAALNMVMMVCIAAIYCKLYRQSSVVQPCMTAKNLLQAVFSIFLTLFLTNVLFIILMFVGIFICSIPPIVYAIVTIVGVTNGSNNAIIYACFCSDFRATVWNFCMQRRQHSIRANHLPADINGFADLQCLNPEPLQCNKAPRTRKYHL